MIARCANNRNPNTILANELVRRFPERPPPFPGPVMSIILELIHGWRASNIKSAGELENEDREAQSAKLQELIRRGTPRDLAAALNGMTPVDSANAQPRKSAVGLKHPPRDLLVKACTGTGNTLAFLAPAIEARLKAIEEAG